MCMRNEVLDRVMAEAESRGVPAADALNALMSEGVVVMEWYVEPNVKSNSQRLVFSVREDAV